MFWTCKRILGVENIQHYIPLAIANNNFCMDTYNNKINTVFMIQDSVGLLGGQTAISRLRGL